MTFDRVDPWGRGIVAALLAALLVASCGAKAASTAGPTTTRVTGVAARCAAYRELSALDVRIQADIARLSAGDRPRLRTEMAAAFARNRTLYGAAASGATGALRAEAQLVSNFMSKSRATLLASPSFDAYIAAVRNVPGDPEVRAAATHLNADAANSCDVQVVHPTPTTTSS